MKKIVIIDGNSLAFGRMPNEKEISSEISKSAFDNRDIYIVRKFIKKILKFKYAIFPGYELIVIFDEQNKFTFRHELSEKYKNKKISPARQEQKKYIYKQINEIKKILNKLNIPYYSNKDWEADDIIGMLIEKLERKNYLSTIVSGDKDILQLISDKTRVAFTLTGMKFEIADRNNLWEITGGVWPDQVIEIKMLSGDKSDNIKGIGILRNNKLIDYWTVNEATKLIKKFGSIDSMMKDIEKINEPYKSSLINAKEKLNFNRKLVTIVRNWMIDIDIDHFIKKEINIDMMDYVIKDLKLEALLKNKKICKGMGINKK